MKIKNALLKAYYYCIDIKLYIQNCVNNIKYKAIEPKQIDLDKVKKVLFIVHPDDEILFFFKELNKSSDWLVICMTNAGNTIRRREFEKSMKKIGAQYKMLNFIDSSNINWNTRKVKYSIREILNLREEWDMVLTHNYEGEYGHNQHKQLFNMVLECYNGENLYISAPEDCLYEDKNKLKLAEREAKIKFMNEIYESQDSLSKYILKYYDYEGIINYYRRRK